MSTYVKCMYVSNVVQNFTLNPAEGAGGGLETIITHIRLVYE